MKLKEYLKHYGVRISHIAKIAGMTYSAMYYSLNNDGPPISEKAAKAIEKHTEKRVTFLELTNKYPTKPRKKK